MYDKQSYESGLWRAYLNGDTKALGTIAELYYRSLYNYGVKFGVDHCVAEDCIQDLFLGLWQNRLSISPTPSVRYYLLKAMRNQILDYLRYQKRLTVDIDWDWCFPDHLHIEHQLIEGENNAELIKKVHSFMALLTKREREALYLRYFEDLSVSQIANVMEINNQSVSNFLQKGLIKLRGQWVTILVLLSLLNTKM